MRLPNSTPMVKSCTRWNRLSVNCNNRQDLPTPAKAKRREERKKSTLLLLLLVVVVVVVVVSLRVLNDFEAHQNDRRVTVNTTTNCLPVSPIIMYLSRYA